MQQQRSLLRAGVYDQTWKWPVCGTDLGQFSQGSFPGVCREHGTERAPLFCTFGALLPSPRRLALHREHPAGCPHPAHSHSVGNTGVSLSWALSSPAQPLPTSSHLPCPLQQPSTAQPSGAAQSGLVPLQCSLQGAAELWPCGNSPSPSEGHSRSWGAERGLSLPTSPRADAGPKGTRKERPLNL